MIIGIDLGTTNSCAAYINGDHAEVLNLSGKKTNTLASAVSFTGNDRILGYKARERALRDPENTITSAKRLIGRTYFEVSSLLKDYPFTVGKSGSSEEPVVIIHGHGYTIPEISAQILLQIKNEAEKHLKQKVTGAVITVPAYFTDVQREATRKAGKIAGLEVPLIISEPTAAALAYHRTGKTAVFDLGGGTFDISVLDISKNQVRVIATGGDLLLGGDDIDRSVLKKLEGKFEKEIQTELRDSEGRPCSKEASVIIQRLRNEAEKAKIKLSDCDVYENVIEDIFRGREFRIRITRRELDRIMEPFIDRTLSICTRTLKEAGIGQPELDNVILVGGSTKSPYVRNRVAAFFGRTPDTSLNPDEAVALGAAEAIRKKNMKAFSDVTPLDLALEMKDGKMALVIPRHTPIPVSRKIRLTTAQDCDDSMLINVHQLCGKHPTRIGSLILSGISAPEGKEKPVVNLNFRITESGIIILEAEDSGSGTRKKAALQKVF